MDRTRAAQFGLTQLDVANSLLRLAVLERPGAAELLARSAKSASLTRSPSRRRSIGWIRSADDGEHAHRGADRRAAAAVEQPGLGRAQAITPVVANHRNVQPVFDVYANVQNSDLGSVAARDRKHGRGVPQDGSPGSEIVVRGQVESMQEAFTRLGIGLAFAAMLVYLLMVVNFQSWTDPFIIITALPGRFAGIVWMLFVTQTTFSVPS